MCLWRCFRGLGDGGLLIRCLKELRDEGGEIDGDRPLRFLSFAGEDLRDDRDEDVKTGEGERRIRGGDGVRRFDRFLCGERDLRLLRGDRLRDLRSKMPLLYMVFKITTNSNNLYPLENSYTFVDIGYVMTDTGY